MKRFSLIMCFFLTVFFLHNFSALAKKQTEGGLSEELLEEELPPPADETQAEEEVIEEEEPPEETVREEPEEEEEPAVRQPLARPAARPPAPAEAEEVAIEEDEGNEMRDVIIDGVINLSYVFDNSPDNFVLKYHIHMEGKIAAKTAVVKGDANIATEVTGFLAKWPTGECKLLVNVPSTPFQITFQKTADDKANINLVFPQAILETWESKCIFKDAPDAKFDTKGEPEKWLTQALQRARPPLARMTVNLATNESTTMKFQISKQTIKDPPLGSVEVDGTGVVTVKPSTGG